MRDKSYKEQDGCHNCKKSFLMTDYEAGPEYFCHADESYRPLCGAGHMGEYWGDFCDQLYDDILSADRWNFIDDELSYNASRMFTEAWFLWEDEHKVEAWGYCDKHERIEE